MVSIVRHCSGARILFQLRQTQLVNKIEKLQVASDECYEFWLCKNGVSAAGGHGWFRRWCKEG